jgi:hypothetical protein
MGFNSWQADTNQSQERDKSMWQNGFGMELKLHVQENVCHGGRSHFQKELSKGPISQDSLFITRDSFPLQVSLSCLISAGNKNHQRRTSTFKYLRVISKQESFLWLSLTRLVQDTGFGVTFTMEFFSSRMRVLLLRRWITPVSAHNLLAEIQATLQEGTLSGQDTPGTGKMGDVWATQATPSASPPKSTRN